MQAIQKLLDETDSIGCPQWIPDIISRTVASTRMELESLLHCYASSAEIPQINQVNWIKVYFKCQEHG